MSKISDVYNKRIKPNLELIPEAIKSTIRGNETTKVVTDPIKSYAKQFLSKAEDKLVSAGMLYPKNVRGNTQTIQTYNQQRGYNQVTPIQKANIDVVNKSLAVPLKNSLQQYGFAVESTAKNYLANRNPQQAQYIWNQPSKFVSNQDIASKYGNRADIMKTTYNTAKQQMGSAVAYLDPSVLAQSLLLSSVPKVVSNIYNKKPLTEGINSETLSEAVGNSAILKFTNLATDKILSGLSTGLLKNTPLGNTLSKLTPERLNAPFQYSKQTLNNALKNKTFLEGAKRQVMRVLAEVPMESLAFGGETSIRNKESFIKSVVESIPSNIIGNLAFAGLNVGLQGSSIYKKQFQEALQKAIKDNMTGKKEGFIAPKEFLPKKSIPKELEGLAQEARKYKSAEEFIQKLQDTPEVITGKMNNEERLALRDSFNAGTEKFIKQETEKFGDSPIALTGIGKEKIKQNAKRAFLTDIYNQATKGVSQAIPKELEGLAQEARKYKSAIEAENLFLEKNAGKKLDNGITIPEGYKAYRRTVTGETVDVNRLRTDPKYFKEAYESTFARGYGTDEKLYKTLTKELVPKDREASSYLAELYNQATKGVDTGMEALKAEARKYKSAEEFVKAQGIPAYHGTDANFEVFDLNKVGTNTDSGMFGKGFYFSDNAKYAKTYARKTGNVKEVILDMKKPYIINAKEDIPNIEVPNKTLADLKNGTKNYSNKFTEYLQSKGYDGVIDNISGERQYVVFNPSQIKTKSQLTDIFNQATKGVSQADTKLSKKDIEQTTSKTQEQRIWEQEFGKPITEKEAVELAKMGWGGYLKNKPPSGIVPTTKDGKYLAVSAGKTQDIDNTKAEVRAKVDFLNYQKKLFEQEGATLSKSQYTNKAINDIGKNIGNTQSAITRNIDEIKDINPLTDAGLNTVYRIFKKAFGKSYGSAKTLLLDPFDDAKGRLFKNYENWSDRVDKEIVRGLGIKPKSTESEAVQRFGEKQEGWNYGSLVNKFGKEKADNIQKADSWFRKEYDQLLDEVNAVMARIYPNNPERIIPRREDYYRHFRQMAEGFAGLKNIFESPAGVQSTLSGISEYTKPRSKWLSFAQKRLGLKTEYDAIGGFIDYVGSAEYAKEISPFIQKFRNLADDISKQAESKPENANKYNTLIWYLNEFSNNLAGKTGFVDRPFIQLFGRKPLAVMNWTNNRVKGNTILMNASSSLAQIANIPQGIASAGIKYSTLGLKKSLFDIVKPSKEMQLSPFLKERYFKGFDKFETGYLKDTKKFAKWMLTVLDEVGTKFIWNSHYEKAIKEGISDPIRYADDTTKNLVGGRGIGEVPLLQQSKIFQLIAPFQLEVTNYWYVAKEFMDAKQFGKIATLLLGGHIVNRGINEIRGSDVSFDPIQAVREGYQAYQEEEDKRVGTLRFAGRVGGEFLSNVPLGQTVASVYPEYGLKFGDETVTRKELFGKGDPTRYGSGILASKGIKEPFKYLIPPFGGVQIDRTIKGIKSLNRGYSETPQGQVKFPIKQNIENTIKSPIFGENSTKEARNYYETDKRPLGDKQSDLVKTLLSSNYDREANLIYQKPDKTLEEWRKLSPDERLKEYRRIKSFNPQKAKDILKEITYQKLKATKKEKGMVEKSVAERAKYSKKQLTKISNRNERLAYYKRLKDLGIITDAVRKELIGI